MAVEAYYESWREGIDSFNEQRLIGLLAEDLDFEGPIAGNRRGAPGFIAGLRRFVEGLRSPIRLVSQVDGDGRAAALYDADLPRGTLRFAEFFDVGGGRITAIRLLYDAVKYVELGGR